MDELMEILEEIRPDVDFESEEALIDDKILSSFDILSIVSEISDAFSIQVTPAYMIPKNFNSARALWEMIGQIKEK